MTQNAPLRIAWLAMIASTVLFAASYTLTKVALVDVPPLTLGLIRFALAGALLFLLRRAGPRPGKGERTAMVASGLLGITLYFALENVGVHLATATDAALLVASYPALTVGVEACLNRKRPALQTLLGLAVTAAGVVLVVAASGASTGDPGGPPATHRLLGDVLLIGSGLSWAGYTLVSRHFAARRPPLQTVTWQDTIGAVFFIPLALTEAPQWVLPRHPTATAVSVLVLVVGCSIAAMAFYNRALAGLPASTAVNALNLVPLWGVLIAVLTLGEHVRPLHLIGAVVIILGVYLTGTARRDRPVEPPPSTSLATGLPHSTEPSELS